MKFLSHPLLNKGSRITYLIFILVLLSCESDPIIFNPSGGYEYLHQKFLLNKDSSRSFQGDMHTGLSQRLYSGFISDEDSALVFINLSPGILDSHSICSAHEINNMSFILNTVSPILLKDDSTVIDTFIDFSSLEANMVLSDLLSEDILLSDELINQQINQTAETPNPTINLFDSSIEIDLLSTDSNIVSKWCEEDKQIGLILKYSPNDSSNIEFYSSDISTRSLAPKLYMNYSNYDEKTRIYNRYSIDKISWSNLINFGVGPYFVKDSTSLDWGTFYLMDLNSQEQIIDNPPLDYSSVSSQSNLINAGENRDLITITLKLNPLLLDEIDSIEFLIQNAYGYISDYDPQQDNYDIDLHPENPENNLQYDAGELFNDFGLDNCPDSLETGLEDNKCSADLSAYNLGKEGNNIRDWVDYNNNNKWDEGEGEEWGDWGNDWCPDSLEGGSGICLASPPEFSLGYDPNQDNIDPVGDDWDSVNNLDGTENNKIWDLGESWLDWGTDGLPISILGYADSNGSENNGVYDYGESFDDTGSDGLFNIEEVGYNDNRTEGNGQFDGHGEFNDFGLDNLCPNCEGDSDSDDYNIDPNNDNWRDCGNDKICSENEIDYDLDGSEGNGEWDQNERTENNGNLDIDGLLSEEWFDWGIDGVHDSLEAFQSSSSLPIMIDQSNYVFNLNGGDQILSYENTNNDTILLWISKIARNDSVIVIDIGGKSHLGLRGLEFQLIHTPFSKVDTLLVDHKYYIEDYNNSKIFKDLTLAPKKEYSVEYLSNNLLIEYSNDVCAVLEFDSLNEFINNEEYIFSHEYSNLVFYIDNTRSHIDEKGMQISIVHTSENNLDQVLATKMIFGETDSVEVQIGQALRAFQSGTIDTYNGFKIISSNSNLYNYSKLFFSDNPRLDIMYTK